MPQSAECRVQSAGGSSTGRSDALTADALAADAPAADVFAADAFAADASSADTPVATHFIFLCCLIVFLQELMMRCTAPSWKIASAGWA